MYENVEHFSFVSKKKCLFVSRQERYGFLSKYLEFRFVLSQKFSTSNSRRQSIYSMCGGVETLFASLFGWYTEYLRVKARNKIKSIDLRFKINLFTRFILGCLETEQRPPMRPQRSLRPRKTQKLQNKDPPYYHQLSPIRLKVERWRPEFSGHL